jgi:hypothetical protein
MTNKQKSEVMELLQVYGDRPEITERNNCDLNWIHVLQICLTELMECARVESLEEDQEANLRKQRRYLSTLKNAAGMWEKQLGQDNRKIRSARRR